MGSVGWVGRHSTRGGGAFGCLVFVVAIPYVAVQECQRQRADEQTHVAVMRVRSSGSCAASIRADFGDRPFSYEQLSVPWESQRRMTRGRVELGLDVTTDFRCPVSPTEFVCEIELDGRVVARSYGGARVASGRWWSRVDGGECSVRWAIDGDNSFRDQRGPRTRDEVWEDARARAVAAQSRSDRIADAGPAGIAAIAMEELNLPDAGFENAREAERLLDRLSAEDHHRPEVRAATRAIERWYRSRRR